MNEPATTVSEGPSPKSWFGPVALVTSLASVSVGVLLCFTILIWAGDWEVWAWARASGTAALALGSAWLAFTVGGFVFGLIALILPHRRQSPAVAAIILSAVSLLLVPGAALAGAWVFIGPDHPSDDRLIDNFRDHESEFAEVVTDRKAKGRVDQSRLRGLNVESLMLDSGEEFYLYVSTWGIGIVPSGSAKGYFYSMTKPSPLVDDLDDWNLDLADGFAYRHVSGPWYLFFEIW